ncbi:MAG TPA: hypothetical protein VFP17_02985 [Solirubrobacterales bacterium]|nr:hypothetical protein [Solirubrobacterales bacterium]
MVENDLLYKLAYDEAVRALSEQQAMVDSFRNRAGLLFSAGAVTVSLLAPRALRGGGWNPPIWLAMLCFIGVAAGTLGIFWPRKWESVVNAQEVIDTYIEAVEAPDVGEVHRELSIHMHASYCTNDEGLRQFALLLQVASGLLTFEVVLWMLAIVFEF